MKKEKTLYHIVLDRSGSMSDCIKPTISGFNEQIQSVRNLQKEYTDQEVSIGVSMFNNEVEHAYFGHNPEKAEMLAEKTYRPNGGTALFDAIVMSANRIENMIMEQKAQEHTTVVLVILTDGYENASRHYNITDVRNTIKRLEETGKWTFNFIGATLDAMEVAENMHFRKSQSMSIDKEELNKEVWGKLNHYMEDYMEEKRKYMREERAMKNIDVRLNKDEKE